MLKKIILFLLGAAAASLVFIIADKKCAPKCEIEEQSGTLLESKIVYDTENIQGYCFPTHTNHIVMDRAYAEKIECIIVGIEPSKSTHRHIHNDTEQLYYVLSGSGYTTMERNGAVEEHTFEPGNVVHIPRNCYHQTFCTSEEPLKYLCVDCFPNGHNPDEPTWEDHVRAMCRDNGWNFDDVVIK